MEYENSECIFIAKVTDFNETKGTFKFEIIESFKGEINTRKFEGKFSYYCLPWINEKGKWLLYGDFNSDNVFEINNCGLSRSFTHPENNMASRIPPPPPPPDKEFTKKEETERFERYKTETRKKAHLILKEEIKKLKAKRK